VDPGAILNPGVLIDPWAGCGSPALPTPGSSCTCPSTEAGRKCSRWPPLVSGEPVRTGAPGPLRHRAAPPPPATTPGPPPALAGRLAPDAAGRGGSELLEVAKRVIRTSLAGTQELREQM